MRNYNSLNNCNEAMIDFIKIYNLHIFTEPASTVTPVCDNSIFNTPAKTFYLLPSLRVQIALG